MIAARLEPGDVGEDEAAKRLAASHRTAPDLRLEQAIHRPRQSVRRLPTASRWSTPRAIDEHQSASMKRSPSRRCRDFVRSSTGDMVATVKIIPFAARGAALDQACSCRRAARSSPSRRIRPLRIGVISTMLPGLKAERDRQDAESAGRAARSVRRSAIRTEARVAHERRDGSPSRSRGWRADCDALVHVRRLGDHRPARRHSRRRRTQRRTHRTFRHAGRSRQPAAARRRGGKPIIGAPGCARSPKENGFDWVLQRLLADVPIGRADIQGMGVGGLLMEIATRPQPRAGDD